MGTGLARALVDEGRGHGELRRPRLVATPVLDALRHAGTEHVYGDTADKEELGGVLAVGQGGVRREVDGNTANQPLVRRVVESYLAAGDPGRWARAISRHRPQITRTGMLALLYAIVCGRIGNDMARTFASGRPWEVSLQLHMGLCDDGNTARSVGRLLREMVPSALVKVPFTPDFPHCLLVARDLERAGIPVNFTSTFSARQAVTAAILADVTRTNVFMGRLDQGLQAALLGEHVVLETQRLIRRLREEGIVKTRLIVASMRSWSTFVRLAGCDAFTAPCGVLRDFIEQEEVPPHAIESRLEASYAEELGVAPEVLARVPLARIERLHRVEPELLEFLRELRRSPDFEKLGDGDALHAYFSDAGFDDVFHAPSGSERAELEHGKLPDLEGLLVQRIPLDTLFSLLANADFSRAQGEIDDEVTKRLDGVLR